MSKKRFNSSSAAENLTEYRTVTETEVEQAISYMLKQPAIQKMINAAKELYSESDKIMQGLMEVRDISPTLGFGAREKSKIWSPYR